jgi:uncharacterized protein (DUF305 family)
MLRFLLVLTAVLAAGAPSEAAPIFQPGAPGEPSREISPEAAVTLSRSGFVEADVVFMQHMIVHHAQAVEMVALLETRGAHPGVRRLGERIASNQATEMDMMRAWLEERGQPLDDPHLSHGHHHGGAHSAHDHHGDHTTHHGHSGHHDHSGHRDHHAGHSTHGGAGGHAHHGHQTPPPVAADPGDIPLMPGMLSPNQIAALAVADGAEFDRLFLEGMIVHHQGALDMVDDLIAQPGSAQDPQLSDFLSHVVSDQSAEILRMQSLLSEM